MRGTGVDDAARVWKTEQDAAGPMDHPMDRFSVETTLSGRSIMINRPVLWGVWGNNSSSERFPRLVFTSLSASLEPQHASPQVGGVNTPSGVFGDHSNMVPHVRTPIAYAGLRRFALWPLGGAVGSGGEREMKTRRGVR